jgi:toxin-antitoxin system PIN domain toxin
LAENSTSHFPGQVDTAGNRFDDRTRSDTWSGITFLGAASRSQLWLSGRIIRTVIALDTNILVYAHRQDSPFHASALDILDELGNGYMAWAIPWPCLHEFIGIVTHPRIYCPPSSIDTALSFLENWMQSESLLLLAEGDSHFTTISRLARRAKLAGPKVHDARIAALCLAHGVDMLYTADRDFSLFPELKTKNPLI